MTATEHPDDRARRWPGEHLFSDSQAIVDFEPAAATWICDVALAQSTDVDTLLRIREGLVKL